MDVPAIVKSAETQTKISKLAWTCMKAAEPWSVKIYRNEARKSHLSRVIEKAVEVGLQMFGERSGWLTWQWEETALEAQRASAESSLVVFPGLELRRGFGNGRSGPIADGESGRGMSNTRSEVVLAPTVENI